MIRGEFLKFTVKQLNTLEDSYSDLTDLASSHNFRSKAIRNGYELIELYPIYYQEWEMDSYGAIAKDVVSGDKYVLETGHGSLSPRRLHKNWKPKFGTMKIFLLDNIDNE
jgi:hypothetical protein